MNLYEILIICSKFQEKPLTANLKISRASIRFRLKIYGSKIQDIILDFGFAMYIVSWH